MLRGDKRGKGFVRFVMGDLPSPAPKNFRGLQRDFLDSRLPLSARKWGWWVGNLEATSPSMHRAVKGVLQCFNIRAISRPSGRKPSSSVSRRPRSKREGNRLSPAARVLRITAAGPMRRATRPRGRRTAGAITSSVRNCERSWNEAGKGRCASAARRFFSDSGMTVYGPAKQVSRHA